MRITPEQLFQILDEECAKRHTEALLFGKGVPEDLSLYQSVCDRLNTLGSCGHAVLDADSGACGVPGCVNEHQAGG